MAKSGMYSSGQRDQVVADIAKVRQLIAKYGINTKTAELTGRTKGNLSRIKNGNRHKHTGAIPLSSLDLRYSTKLCRRCGEVAGIVTKTNLCIKCDLRQLAIQGAIAIQPEVGNGDECE